MKNILLCLSILILNFSAGEAARIIKISSKSQLESLIADRKAFYRQVFQRSLFVKFYAPTCGHCVKMALDYEKLADKLHEMADIAEVNCQSHPLICGGIRGYPTLKFYSSNGFSKPKSELGRFQAHVKSTKEIEHNLI